MARPIDGRLVTEVAATLRGPRGLRFSDRQLWYAVCARLEAPELTEATAQLGVGAVLIAAGVLLGILASPILALLVPVGMVLTGLAVQRRRLERNRPATRSLAVSYDSFVRDTLAPIRAGIEGLLPADAVQTPPSRWGSGGVAPPSRPLLVCDRAETAALLAALGEATGIDADVVDEAMAGGLGGGRPVFAVHDADPRGCGLALRLAAATPTAAVVDAGLRPAQLFERRVQVIEGAPALVPAELASLLTPDEIVWLAEGRRVELATLAPEELVAGIGAALVASPRAPAGGAPHGPAVAGAPLVPPGGVAAPAAQSTPT